MLAQAADIAAKALVWKSDKVAHTQYLNEQLRSGGRPRTRAQDGLLHQWMRESTLYSMTKDFEVLDFLRLCMGTVMAPIQTRTYGRGSSVPAHADTIFADTLPRRGRIVGIMVAFEDFKPEAGPTFVIPGTHSLSLWDHAAVGLANTPSGRQDGVDFNLTHYLRAAKEADLRGNMSYNKYAEAIQRIVDARGWQRRSAELKRGDVLVWAGSLIHGSQPVQDANSTRLSMSAHYLDAEQRYRWNPMSSNKGDLYTYGARKGKQPQPSEVLYNRVLRVYGEHLSKR